MSAPRRLRRAAQDLDRQDPEVQAPRHGQGCVIAHRHPGQAGIQNSGKQRIALLFPRQKGESTISLEETFHTIAGYVALVIEVGAVLVVAWGTFQAIATLAVAIVTGAADEIRGRVIWLKFATWILLGLEFALAADIVHTAVAPTWQDIWKLAVIAVIRTMLNYFLAKDIANFSQLQDSGQNSPSRPATS